jgi:hypothetical protein
VVVVTGDPTVVGAPGGAGVGAAVLEVVAAIVVVVDGREVIGLVVVVVDGRGADVVVVRGTDVVDAVAAVATSAATSGPHATATATVISSQRPRNPLTRIRTRTSLTPAIAPAEPPHCTQEQTRRSGAARR